MITISLSIVPHHTIPASRNVWTLSLLEQEGLLDNFLAGLGFIHANDHCRRNCAHCPAHGDKTPQLNMPFEDLERIVADVGQALTQRGIVLSRSVVSWRISDPLDYYVRHNRMWRSTYDVAQLWHTHLRQGLYIVTNGSEGKPRARTVLHNLVREPELLSQIKLTVTPFDILWGTRQYFWNIVEDIRILAPLWEMFSERIEDPEGLRFRINVKVTEATRKPAEQFMEDVLQELLYCAKDARDIMNDRKKVRFKPVYNLGSYTGDSPIVDAIKLPGLHGERWKPTEQERDRYQYAVYPDFSVRIVDMYTFRVHPVLTRSEQPLLLAR